MKRIMKEHKIPSKEAEEAVSYALDAKYPDAKEVNMHVYA